MDFDLEACLWSHLPASLASAAKPGAAVYLAEDIGAAILQAVTDYNLRKHSAIRTCPLKKWQSLWPYEIERPFNEDSIFAAFTVLDTVKVRHDAILLPDGTEYKSESLIGYRFGTVEARIALQRNADLVTISSGNRIIAQFPNPQQDPVLFKRRGKSPENSSGVAADGPRKTTAAAAEANKPASSPTGPAPASADTDAAVQAMLAKFRKPRPLQLW